MNRYPNSTHPHCLLFHFGQLLILKRQFAVALSFQNILREGVEQVDAVDAVALVDRDVENCELQAYSYCTMVANSRINRRTLIEILVGTKFDSMNEFESRVNGEQ